MAERTGWAIAGNCGLYVGWQQTRGAAIAEHVRDLYGARGSVFGQPLTDEQRERWKRCKKKGDRAVRVRITYT